jgi:S-methylmethionine-dependent homocysteine/selenocysteine methylase
VGTTTSALEHIRDIRERGGVVVLDGAMGTELQARGAAMDGDAWCGLANLYELELVRGVHEDHIRAGADVITTNTFMSGVGPMHRAGLGDQFEAGVRNAVGAARDAVRSAAARPVAIAGSVGVTPWGAPPVERGSDRSEAAQLRDGYDRQVELLVDGGVDLIVLEMVIDARLGQAAVEAALASGLPVWLGLSMRTPGPPLDEAGWLPDIDPEAHAVAQACLRDELDAVNVMHTDIHDVSAALQMLRPLWPGAIGVYPHHGLWSQPQWAFVDVAPEELVQLASEWVALGATMLGGCCGLRTHHVAALRSAVDAGLRPRDRDS